MSSVRRFVPLVALVLPALALGSALQACGGAILEDGRNEQEQNGYGDGDGTNDLGYGDDYGYNDNDNDNDNDNGCNRTGYGSNHYDHSHCN